MASRDGRHRASRLSKQIPYVLCWPFRKLRNLYVSLVLQFVLISTFALILFCMYISLRAYNAPPFNGDLTFRDFVKDWKFGKNDLLLDDKYSKAVSVTHTREVARRMLMQNA